MSFDFSNRCHHIPSISQFGRHNAAGRAACGRLPALRVTASAKRQPKDPSKFSYDDIRQSLHEEEGSGPGFAGLLNFLSSNAFGAVSAGAARTATIYRQVLDSPWASKLQSGVEQRPGYRPPAQQAEELWPAQESDASASSTADAQSKESCLRGLQLIFSCSRGASTKLTRMCPALLTMGAGKVQQRLIALKEVLPDCDVAALVMAYPRQFLEPPLDQLLEKITAAAAVLRAGLEGARIDAMIHEDPTLLLVDSGSLSTGVKELRQLWDVDEEALGSSDPWKLALALRAMSPTGPPPRF